MTDPTRNIQNLALIGFMGTGKSAVGRQVAALLNFDFVDTDEMIEKQTGQRITDIFAQHGESHFRQLEADTIKTLETRHNLIISTGGGSVVQPQNLASLRTHSYIICLWASPEGIYKRVRHQTHRPLLQGDDPIAKIATLLKEREPAYRQADHLINSELRPLHDLAYHVAYNFRCALRDTLP